MSHLKIYITLFIAFMMLGCNDKPQAVQEKSAADILGNPKYLAISYGGYRENTRDVQPTILELKEDMKILSAMGIKILRTYNVHLAQASNLLKAIRELKTEDESFEMYVMLGAWIDCKDAFDFNKQPDHNAESERNAVEIETAIRLTQTYPDIVKIIAVGNEAMVKWATSYYVQPAVILKWVNHLQDLKQSGDLPPDLWITSSDNFASWGGGEAEYHTEDLNELIKAVDYISMHTYPMHDTHYHPVFWGVEGEEAALSDIEKIDAAMARAKSYAISQYDSVYNYMTSLGVKKPIHIGETGWASMSNALYGTSGSKATDEYKEALYYKNMREWTNKAGMSCFYFEAFDEQWKDADNPLGSENYFGLINLKGEAKYALWNLVDQGVFDGLTRNGKPITKTFGGDKEALMQTVPVPPIKD
ncbi:exo-beta-1,3-glucanase (GH17 family) [Formosa algae]|uniref:Endo-1,3-beta-glucanase btgC n=2 Tax=Formosa algae TaxID=225843 RepID=A0A9X1CC59_9FLAO|nr:glycosyl hydrolase family 17 [Formosa algae]MBP1839915.1 exo-beta-1,3-glucanase (GH17 family) [Formosa algae]MDQ0335514.1 exo-beta-1,3-glucanase (GH17 family) [Formosa algae]OEI81782.1 glycosyl hydrolase family 17 [Formosa algae]